MNVALKPQVIAKNKIMIVDDEQPILDALKRLFRRQYDVSCFLDARQALEALAKDEFAAIISDMKMPIMSGAEFLASAYSMKPDIPRLLLTGFSDVDDTTRAINQGKITNYVSKPWLNVELKNLVEQAVEQYQLKRSVGQLQEEVKLKNNELEAQNRLLEKKVADRTAKLQKYAQSLKKAQRQQRLLFQDIIEMINLIVEEVTEEHAGHIKRVASHCRLLAEKLGLDRHTVTHCYLAGLMHEIGKVTLDDELIKQTEDQMDKAQRTKSRMHALKGAEILKKVPHLRPISLAVKHQYEHYDGSGFPEHLVGEQIPMAARILAVVNDFDKFIIGRSLGTPVPRHQAIAAIQAQAKNYDPTALATYIELLDLLLDFDEYHTDTCLTVELLEEGMTLSRDLKSQQGAVLLTKDTELNLVTIGKLKQYQKDWDYFFNVFVH
ncbi:hypothetical protein C2869_02415 [Saccharobesus litoralis]|uniref:Uncharacterized protein n=1 Tax=Saccharobesus litoralis TaxID=2172099 RepID=A0A2S0VMF4_9ALTE|nr:HD domain-containing phosphohydrolase [Saccharobesus litoralis]AWB65362.1 hypothetical protein C2869_02415 [Saccharobesus litoralis]